MQNIVALSQVESYWSETGQSEARSQAVQEATVSSQKTGLPQTKEAFRKRKKKYLNAPYFTLYITVCPRSSDQFYLVTYYIR